MAFGQLSSAEIVTFQANGGELTVVGRTVTVRLRRFQDDAIQVASGTGLLVDKLVLDLDCTDIEIEGTSNDSAFFLRETFPPWLEPPA